LVEYYSKNVNQEKVDKIINNLDSSDDMSSAPVSQRSNLAQEETAEELQSQHLQRQLVTLVCVLNPRDFFNRHLFYLEDHLEQYNSLHKQLEASHRLLITQLNQKLTERDLQAQKMSEDFQSLRQIRELAEQKHNDKMISYECLQQKYKKKKEEFKALKYELQNETVPLEEFQRVQENNS